VFGPLLALLDKDFVSRDRENKRNETNKTLRGPVRRTGYSAGRLKKEEMTKAELGKFKSVLEATHTQLTASLRNRDEIVISKAPDVLDQVQMASERELATRHLDRDSNMLRQIREALARIAGDSYGVCRHCEEDISPKRVNAVPWASLCVKRQEQLDRQEIEVDDTSPCSRLLPDCAVRSWERRPLRVSTDAGLISHLRNRGGR
jgi:DnaK suppressor protein